MAGQSVYEFVFRVVSILRMGVEVGITSGMTEEDWETGETWFTLFSDLKFRMRDGKVYCKGGSVMYPPPVTDEEGWEVEPVDDRVLESMFQCNNTLYVMIAGQKVTLWTYEQGWDNSKKFLNAEALSKIVDTPAVDDVSSENKGMMSLKVIAAETAREHMGVLALREFEHFMDYEVRERLFTPPSWWVSF